MQVDDSTLNLVKDQGLDALATIYIKDDKTTTQCVAKGRVNLAALAIELELMADKIKRTLSKGDEVELQGNL